MSILVGIHFIGGVVKYFAYGSNMSLLRLQKRVPSAEFIAQCQLTKHELRWHKSGKDGSGKCDTFETEIKGDVVIGALFDIKASEKGALDLAEGLGYGYNEKKITVTTKAGDEIEAFTYYAISIDLSVKPYDWYVNHVMVGAIEIKVPEHYLATIKAIEHIEDPDKERALMERAIYMS